MTNQNGRIDISLQIYVIYLKQQNDSLFLIFLNKILKIRVLSLFVSSFFFTMYIKNSFNVGIFLFVICSTLTRMNNSNSFLGNITCNTFALFCSFCIEMSLFFQIY